MVPSSVRRAFGVEDADLRLLAGGLGDAYRAGDLVLKQVDDTREAEFIAEVISRLEVDESQVQISRPIRTRGARWLFDGWAAWTFLEGSHAGGPHDWRAAERAIAALHEGLARAGIDSKPPKRRHRWAVADRVAWGEEDAAGLDPRVEGLVTGMRTMAPGIGSQAQLIHGDLAGNLLFRPAGPPGVIDFSPLRRPAASR